MDDVIPTDDADPDWQADFGETLIDPDFDDDWLPDWLPSHRRDNSLDDWI
jgi:hypothetical protein